MLSELYQASCTEPLKGVFGTNWHKNYTPLKKGNVFRLFLDKDSKIEDLQLFPKNTGMEKLRKYEPSNGNSFPCMNVLGLISQSPAEKEADACFLKETFDAEKVKEILKASYVADPEYLKRTIKKIEKCFGVSKVLKEIFEGKDINPNFIKLADRVNAFENGKVFVDEYFEFILSKIVSYEDYETYKGLLCSGGMLAFDIKDVGDFGFISNEETINQINNILLENKKNSAVLDSNEKDAFGNSMEGSDEKLPKVTVSFLGNISLRSMTKEAPCNFRYGKAENDSFPIGAESRRLCKQTLEALSSPERRGKTWGVIGDAEVLFAYPDKLPEEETGEILDLGDFDIMGSFIRPDRKDVEVDFETASENVMGVLKLKGPVASKVNVNLFALRKVDDGHSKVTYRDYFTVKYLEECVENWKKGCKNIPKAWLSNKSITIFPNELCKYINNDWKRDLSASFERKRFSGIDGIKLLLSREVDRDLGKKMLQDFLYGNVPLLSAIGQNKRFFKDKTGKRRCIPAGYEKVKFEKRKIIAALALLMSKAGIKEDFYMNNSIFNLGLLLSLADDMQYEYCKYERTSEEERKQGIVNAPAEFVGNMLLPMAATRTRETIGMVGERMRPYIVWSRGDNGPAKNLHKWHCMQMTKLMKMLSGDMENIPKYLNPEQKSELYMGYMLGVNLGLKDHDEKVSEKKCVQNTDSFEEEVEDVVEPEAEVKPEVQETPEKVVSEKPKKKNKKDDK